MNLSGESVRELVNYYKIDPEEELIVVYDDISLAPGQIRIRKKGSAGAITESKISLRIWVRTNSRGSRSALEKNRRSGISLTMCSVRSPGRNGQR